ncbi:hypothetical protein Tco_0722502 [Tanacetum coccineum]
MNTSFKQLGVKQVGFKQLDLGVETGVHGVLDEKRLWFKVELQGAQRNREAEVFQVSNDDTAVAQRWLKDKQPEEKKNTECLVKEHEKEYHIGWKIKSGNVFDSCNQRSTQQCMKIWVAKYLGVGGIQQQNGLVDEINMTLFAKVCCFLIQSGLSKVFWAEDTTRSTYLVNRSPSLAIGFKKPLDILEFFGWLASIKQGMLEPVKVKCIFLGYHESIVGNKLWRLDDITSKVVLYRNMGFNESGEYKKTFIGSGVARDMEQHSAWELFSYREDSNEAAFVVAAVEKIYAHESLTFNDTVTKVLVVLGRQVRFSFVLGFKKSDYLEYKSGLSKVFWAEDTIRSTYLVNRSPSSAIGFKKPTDMLGVFWNMGFNESGEYKKTFIGSGVCNGFPKKMQVLHGGFEFEVEQLVAEIWVTKGLLVKAKGNVLGLEIIKDQSGTTLRVSQSRIHNKKLVQTLLEGHSILSLKDSISGDCDGENNGRSITVMSRSITWYGLMILGCSGSLKANLQHMEALSTTKARYMMFTEARKKELWLKRLLTESGYELRIKIAKKEAKEAIQRGIRS